MLLLPRLQVNNYKIKMNLTFKKYTKIHIKLARSYILNASNFIIICENLTAIIHTLNFSTPPNALKYAFIFISNRYVSSILKLFKDMSINILIDSGHSNIALRLFIIRICIKNNPELPTRCWMYVEFHST